MFPHLSLLIHCLPHRIFLFIHSLCSFLSCATRSIIFFFFSFYVLSSLSCSSHQFSVCRFSCLYQFLCLISLSISCSISFFLPPTLSQHPLIHPFSHSIRFSLGTSLFIFCSELALSLNSLCLFQYFPCIISSYIFVFNLPLAPSIAFFSHSFFPIFVTFSLS